jgi:hypothetical protein
MSIFVNNNSDALLLDSPVTAKDVNINGLFTDQNGYIKAIRGGTPTNHSQGIPVDSTGRVCVQQDGTIATWQNGLPYDANNRLCITATEALSTTNGLPFAERLKATTPTLNINFTNRILDSRITFNRASSATFVGSNGLIQTAVSNVARFTHNPITLESLGLLIEEQRTNIFAQSEAFDTWNLAAATVTANAATAPDGANTADRINSTGGGVFLISTIAAGTPHTYSVFAKHVSGSGVVDLLGFENFGGVAANARISVNLLTGVIVSQQANVTGATITPFPNGWYRITVTATSTATTGAVTNYASLSGNQFLLWGAQLEAGAFATSYTPTAGASVTRNADVVSITGANYSGWAGTTSHTIYADFINLFANPAITTVCELNDGVNTSARVLQTTVSNALVSQNMFLAGADQGRIDTANTYSNIRIKVASAFATNNRAIAVNGNTTVTSSTGTVGTYTQLSIGHQNNILQLNGILANLTYWPLRIPNTTLTQLTS